MLFLSRVDVWCLVGAVKSLSVKPSVSDDTVSFVQMLGGRKDRAENVGIIGMDVYVPKMFVSQTDLEQYDGVSQGKYTIGLGQTEMGCVSDREDVNSMALTVTNSILEKYNINPKDIGRLEVGTETPVDKSKSVKTVVMKLFQEHGNTNMEGVDSKNACYGGTAALFNSVAWVESSSWDGRLALVVMADIAVYEKGPARPSGGAGAVALLIGPNAPFVMEPFRGSHFEHAYDFYKPDLSSEYPYVNGQESMGCYLRAVEKCMGDLSLKLSQARGSPLDLENDKIKYQLFHQPFAKMVQKAWPRMILSDYSANPQSKSYDDIRELLSSKGEITSEKEQILMEKDLVKLRKEQYSKQSDVAMALGKRMGNIYTGSLYLNLFTLFTDLPGHVPVQQMVEGDRILMFSYGSGLASTVFTLRLYKPQTDPTLNQMVKVCSEVRKVLDGRTRITPDQYDKMMTHNSENYNSKKIPSASVDETIAEKTYYISSVDESFRRFYEQKVDALQKSNSASHLHNIS